MAKRTLPKSQQLASLNTITPPGVVEINSNYYYEQMTLESDLLTKFRDYEKMDDEVIEIASALDIYADNAVSGGNNLDKEYQIVLSKPDKGVQKVIDSLDKTELRDIVWNIARSTQKYGNWYLEIVQQGDSVARVKELPIKEMRIIKDKFGRIDKIIQKTTNAGEIPLELWKVVHFSVNRPYTYGTSILNRLRRIYRQIKLCEDSLVVARLTKASQKVIYKIDVTGMTTAESLAYLKQWKASMRKKRILNPVTGAIIEDYNPIRDEEDIFLPVKQNSATDVVPLSGDANISNIADIEFLQSRLFSGLKIPKAYLGFEGDTHNRNVITALDVQFARQVRRLQKILEKGLRHIYDVALILAGYNPDEIKYKIVFPVISTIDALTEWQVNQTKLMTAQLLLGLGISIPDEWILGNLLGLPQEEVKEISEYSAKMAKEQEAKDQADKEAELAAQNGGQPPQGGVPAGPTDSGLPPEDAGASSEDLALLNQMLSVSAQGENGAPAASQQSVGKSSPNVAPPEEPSSNPDIDQLTQMLSGNVLKTYPHGNVNRKDLEDLKKMLESDNGMGRKINHLTELVKGVLASNGRLTDMIEGTQELINWKLDWAATQNQISALRKS